MVDPKREILVPRCFSATAGYCNTHNQQNAILLKVTILTKADARYILHKNIDLDEDKFLHLTFLGDSFIPFCFIFHYTLEKEKKYRDWLTVGDEHKIIKIRVV